MPGLTAAGPAGHQRVTPWLSFMVSVRARVLAQ